MKNNNLIKRLIISTALAIIASPFTFSNDVSNINLNYLSSTEVKTNAQKNAFFGISALYYDQEEEKLYALSDDSGFNEKAGHGYTKNSPRMFKLSLNVDKDNKLQMPAEAETENPELILFKDLNGRDLVKQGLIDGEGMTLLPNGNFLIVSEQDLSAYFTFTDYFPQLYKKPNIYEFSKDGCLQHTAYDFPSYYNNESCVITYFSGSASQLWQTAEGIEANKGIEGITAIPESDSCYEIDGAVHQGSLVATLTERPLIQDKRNGFSRLCRFVKTDDGLLKAWDEYAYPIDTKKDFSEELTKDARKVEPGVSDILAIDKNRFIVIERTYFRYTDSAKKSQSVIRLYEVDLSERYSFSNVIGFYSLNRKVALNLLAPLKKKLIRDLWIENKEDGGTFNTYNIEGITFGPALSDGSKSLILCSDNGSKVSQATRFFFFKIEI